MTAKRRNRKRQARKQPAKKLGSKLSRMQKWCLGTVFGLLLLAVIGNHISAVIPNPFQYIFSRFQKTSQKQKEVWHAGGIKNSMKHEVSIGIWSHSKAAWEVDTLSPGQVKWYSDSGPFYMDVQGDMILSQNPRTRMTHTYTGQECYELESKTFDNQPNDEEIQSSLINRIEEIFGGPSPKVLNFVDGQEITFDIFGPTGIKAKILLPVISEGQGVFPFQIRKDQ
jgi:hypothetical protein